MDQYEGTQIAEDGRRYPVEELPLIAEASAVVAGPGSDPEPSPSQTTPSGTLIDALLPMFEELDE